MFTSMEEMFLPCPQRMTSVDKRWKPIPSTERAPNCPRCESSNTKFCYYNNYSLTQPRYFCKSCRRYWTRGGSLRNVPVGGGYRKNRRGKSSKVSSTNERVGLQNSNYSEFESSSSTDPHGNFCKFGEKSLSRSSDTTSSDGFTTDLSVLCAKFLNQAPEVSPCSPSESDANYDLKMECFDQKKTYLEMEDFNLDSNSKIGQVGFVQEFDKNAKEQETNVDSSFDHSFYMPQDMFLSNWNPTTRFFSNFSWHCPVTEFEQWTPPGQLDEDLHPGIPNSSLCSFDIPSFEYLSSP